MPTLSILGASTLAGSSGPSDDVGDFRDVPSSDRGNESYGDRGKLGSYAPSNRDAFRNPADVKMFAGYGADEATLERGYHVPGIRELPAYDKVNYQERSSEPRSPDEDDSTNSAESMEQDWQFRNRNRTSRGFLSRPRVPTERG